ncbi:hypothetical protein AVEN_162142-1 [Araneus ventricosus]|uniref:Uncharacterized protein n=1 Tax=Araneus ventricosus TaxID=182803 RepID=A0A4Y2J6E4_ARAVE|nr:hypothetical protein AVEN_162142-1 [Araneus ventricosus]
MPQPLRPRVKQGNWRDTFLSSQKTALYFVDLENSKIAANYYSSLLMTKDLTPFRGGRVGVGSFPFLTDESKFSTHRGSRQIISWRQPGVCFHLLPVGNRSHCKKWNPCA